MISRPTIAVVGASVRATAFSLLRAGCDVVAADLFADADLKRVCRATQIAEYPAGLADWLSAAECDGWLYTGALENYPDLIASMAQVRPLWGEPAAVVQGVRDPVGNYATLTRAGLNFPETKRCDGKHPGEGDWLHKTGQGASGSGVRHFTNEERMPSTGYWQRRVQGRPGSALFVGEQLVATTRQLVGDSSGGAGVFQYGGTLAPWALPSSEVAKLCELGRILANQRGLRGLFGADFIFDGQQAWIIEVNPRPTAAVEVVERVVGKNLLSLHLAKFGVAVENARERTAPAAGKVILYARQPLVVSGTLSEKLLASTGPLRKIHLADIPNAETSIQTGEPILTVLAAGESIVEVEAVLDLRVVELERELYGVSGGTTS